MQPDQVRFLLQRVAVGTFFCEQCYPLERNTRCQKSGTRSDPLPKESGVYAVRARGDPLWAYVGQSNNLLVRIQHLQGIFQASEMPFTDPHKANPAFWAWMKNQPDLELEVVVAPLSGVSPYWRQGLEFFVIAYHRWQFGCSPRWQFGRMPLGWSSSTDRKRGVRGRNIPVEVVLSCHQPGIVPITKLFDDLSDPLSERWAGHQWSPWYTSERSLPPIREGARGLYRLQRGNQLIFLGVYGLGREDPDKETKTVVESLTRTSKSARSSSLARIFHEAWKLGIQGSFVTGSWQDHELRELWIDTVALYLRQQLTLPNAQFGGDGERPQLPNLQEPLRYLSTWLSPMVSMYPFPLAS